MWHKRNFLRLDSVGYIKNKQVVSIALFYGFLNGPRDPHLKCYLWIYLIYGLHILIFYVIRGRYMWDCTTTQKCTIITIIVIYFSFTQTNSVNNSVRYLWYKYMNPYIQVVRRSQLHFKCESITIWKFLCSIYHKVIVSLICTKYYRWIRTNGDLSPEQNQPNVHDQWQSHRLYDVNWLGQEWSGNDV